MHIIVLQVQNHHYIPSLYRRLSFSLQLLPPFAVYYCTRSKKTIDYSRVASVGMKCLSVKQESVGSIPTVGAKVTEGQRITQILTKKLDSALSITFYRKGV